MKQQTKQSILDTLNQAPIYSLVIPSSGQKVKYRPFTVGEEQSMLMVKESEDIELVIDNIKELIRSCTFGEVDPNTLAYFDIEYFFLKLRSKSIGEEVEISLKCKTPECKGNVDCVFNIEDVKAPTFVKGENVVKLNDTVSLVMKYPGFETLILLLDDKEKSSTIKIVSELIESIVSGDNVYSASDFTFEEKERFIKNMNSKTLKKIIDFIENAPKMVHSVKGKCSTCNKIHEYQLGGIRNFFG